jgi:hypothetical protein
MAVFACTNCGWVRRSPASQGTTSCPICSRETQCLTPSGSLPSGRARIAAHTARALHEVRMLDPNDRWAA